MSRSFRAAGGRRALRADSVHGSSRPGRVQTRARPRKGFLSIPQGLGSLWNSLPQRR